MDEIKRGLYRHYKGNFYFVILVAEYSETSEDLVIYKSVDSGKFFARPKKMFLEKIVVEGVETPRFEHIDQGDEAPGDHF